VKNDLARPGAILYGDLDILTSSSILFLCKPSLRKTDKAIKLVNSEVRKEDDNNKAEEFNHQYKTIRHIVASLTTIFFSLLTDKNRVLNRCRDPALFQ